MRIINKAIALNAAWAFLVTQAVIVPFFLFHQLTLEQIFIIEAIHSFLLFLTDIPASLIADKIGRKKVLILACILRCVGGALFMLANSFNGFILAYIIIGIGNGCFFGTNIAIFYDLRDEEKQSRLNAEKVLSKNHFFRNISIVFSAIAGSIIASYSLPMVAVIGAITAIFPLVIILTMKDKRLNNQISSDFLIRDIVFILNKGEHILKLVLICAILYTAAPYLAIFLLQAALIEIDVPISYFGYILALSLFFSSFIAKHSVEIQNKFGITLALLLISIFPIIAFLTMTTHLLLFLVLSILLLEASRVLSETTLVSIANVFVTNQMRSTINSMISFGVYFSIFLFSLLSSQIVEKYGLTVTMKWFSITYFVFALLLAIPLIIVVNKKKHLLV